MSLEYFAKITEFINKNYKILSISLFIIFVVVSIVDYVNGQTFEYGLIGEEDQNMAIHNGERYFNIVMIQGDGKFMTLDNFVAELQKEIDQ